jgi:DNA polymerase-3 subunit delta
MSVFELAAAIGARNRERVLCVLARNLEIGEAPLRILGSLVWQYRRLWKAKDLFKQGGKEAETARMLRMPPYKVGEFLRQFSETHLSAAFGMFSRTDSKLKGESASAPARVLEALLLDLCDRPSEVGSSRGTRASSPASPPAKAEKAKPIGNVRTIRSGKPSRR